MRLLQPQASSYVLKSLPKTISKSKDQDVPLPNPFPLPRNYRSDVTAALEIGQMNYETESAFLSAVGASIFKYKKFSTKENYIDVATCIIEKYPFMKASKGKPHVSKHTYIRIHFNILYTYIM